MPKKTKPIKRAPSEIELLHLLGSIKASDGAEIPRDFWPAAEALASRGLITLGAARGPGSGWRRAELVSEKHTVEQAALKLVEQLALYWVAEGSGCDEPGSAHEAFELLVKHGYTLSSTRAVFYRPDGSEVVR